MKQKYTVRCVNKGKPFVMPIWTVEKHESALAKLAADQKKEKWDDIKADKEWKYYAVHESLSEVDPGCSLEDIRQIHPITIVELSREVLNAGRENIYYKEDFQKGRKTQKAKK